MYSMKQLNSKRKEAIQRSAVLENKSLQKYPLRLCAFNNESDKLTFIDLCLYCYI